MAAVTTFGDANAGFQAGTISGPVQNSFQNSFQGSFHLPPVLPDTPPCPTIVIPFARDTDFVERGVILQEICVRCAAPDSRTALVGLGGVGKSQLAIEHAYRTREQWPERWVFWVYASNAARFEQSFRDIADCVKIAGRQDPQANIFKLVHDWLRDSKQRWLLVLDNVDDARFLLDRQGNGQGRTNDSKTSSRPLREYLPHCEQGSILVTTRNREAALKLVEHGGVITVEQMDEPSALALFNKKLVEQGGSSDIAELAIALDYMPLAIVQAAAYISQRSPRYSVSKYLDEYRKSERKRTSLLNYDEGHLRRDWEAKNSIIVTWQISFEHIQQIRPSAADLLSLMSFFDRQGIPDTLLRRREDPSDAQTDHQPREEGYLDSNEESDGSQHSGNDDEFEEDVVALRNFCFVSVEANGTTFEMHTLVQLAMRMWLEANGQLERWRQQFISNLCAEFPVGEYENWTACQALFAHAKAAMKHWPEADSSRAEWAALLYRAAWYAWRRGSVGDAEMLAVRSMKAWKKVLGEEHEDTLWGKAMLGLAYKLGGRWDDAEKLEAQVMETRKRKLGADHPDTLTSMGNLALTYWNQGRWDDAEKLQVQVMETCKRKLGADHPDTLISLGNLAFTYGDQGRWDDAEKLEIEAVETSKRRFGADNQDTLISMGNLALIYSNQGRWDDAEKLEVQVTETFKRKFGMDHPETLISMGNLALINRNQGRWDDAEKLQVQVAEAHRTRLGADHPYTLTSVGNLASTYRNQGRWDDAEKLEVQVMETRRTKLGADHPSTLTSMGNLASTYRNQGRWDDAEKLEVQVMETRRTKLGADHPSTLTSMGNLASTYWNQGRWDDAEKLETQVMETRKRKLGADHPDTLTSMGNLALTYWNQGRWDDAEKLQVQVMETRKRKLGAGHPETLTSMNNLALTWKEQNRTGEAINLMKQCVQLLRQVLKADHPDLLSSLTALEQWEAEQIESE